MSTYHRNRPVMKSKVERHQDLCSEINALYARKNADYYADRSGELRDDDGAGNVRRKGTFEHGGNNQ